MRPVADAKRIYSFIHALAVKADEETCVYLTGGATAVLVGWRTTTIDVDIKIVPDSDRLLRVIPELKETLQINIELASPDLFIPPLPQWQERSPLITKEGKIAFYHYDFYAQALAKIERGHSLDLSDVKAMLERKGLPHNNIDNLADAILPWFEVARSERSCNYVREDTLQIQGKSASALRGRPTFGRLRRCSSLT